MKSTKPVLEKVSPSFGSSFSCKQFMETCQLNHKPFWHVHPELELVYVKGGSGKRHIGNHLSYFNNGNLVFIGSNLPHLGFTDRLTGNQTETVIQMKADFLGTHFFDIPEMSAVQQLFKRARQGISFYGETKEVVGGRMERLGELNPFNRLLELLSILEYMAHSKEYVLLNVSEFAVEVEREDNDRARIIYAYVRQHFHEPISLEEIAEEVNLTVPAFCRYFKKLSGKTFTRFVNEFRVVHACKLLAESTESITDICFESGFNNISHFNKHFREVTGKSPSAYRKSLGSYMIEG